MKTTNVVALLLVNALFACGGTPPEAPPPPAPEETLPVAPDSVEGPKAVDAPVMPGAVVVSPFQSGKEGDSKELVDALKDPKSDSPVYAVLKDGVKAGTCVINGQDNTVAHVVKLKDATTVVVNLICEGAQIEAEVAIADLRYLKDIDFVALGQEIQRSTVAGLNEIDDYDMDEATRRTALGKQGGKPSALPDPAKDFDCVSRFSRISASRDFIPFPLTNCAAPQPFVGDAERIADAVRAREVGQNIYNKMVADYNNAQAMIASLQAQLGNIQNAYLFILTDSHYKEYNLSHFKDVLHGRKDYNSRFDRAQAVLAYAAQAIQNQIAAYQQVPPPSVTGARSQANRIVATKWKCVLGTGLLNNGGRSGSNIVGVTLETLGAPFVDIQIMLDDHPPMPQKDGWGGIFDTLTTSNLTADVTRLPVSSFVPVRASVGVPIVMIRFQPLDAKKTRPVGQACMLRAGIVQ